MVRIPAFCEKCKFVFESNFIGSIRKGATVHLRGSGVSCPKCGGKAKMLDGVYKNVDGVLEIFVENQSVEDLQKILSILEYAKKHELDREEIVNKIKKEAPELSKLTDILPKTRVELYTFLMVIIMFIGQLISLSKRGLSRNELKQNFDLVVKQYYLNKEEMPVTPKVTIKEQDSTNFKVGRNDPCPCGSGKKYKKCCGK